MSDDDPIPDDEVIITVPVEMQTGVWANWARVNEGDHEFTIRFTTAHTGELTDDLVDAVFEAGCDDYQRLEEAAVRPEDTPLSGVGPIAEVEVADSSPVCRSTNPAQRP